MLNSMGLIPCVEILAPMPDAAGRLHTWFLRLPSVLAAAVGQTGSHRTGAPPRPCLEEAPVSAPPTGGSLAVLRSSQPARFSSPLVGPMQNVLILPS